jgi:hypothetical protein
MRRNNKEVKILDRPIIIYGIILITLLLVTSGMAWAHLNEQYVDARVIDKYVHITSFYCKYGCTTDRSHYDIYTNKGTFEIGIPSIDRIFNENIFSMNQRNAKIIYDPIQKEKSYRLHSYGYRIDILNVYPIVTDVKEE